MNIEAMQKALSFQNLVHVGEATKIAPHILQQIIDGKYTPLPSEVDALKGFFLGEYSICSTDSQWKRRRKVYEGAGTLPLPSPVVCGTREYSAFAPPPSLKQVREATFNPGSLGSDADAFTGTGKKVQRR